MRAQRNLYMQYGFVIDNRKCIGCHACTVACKSEHDVPVGVNRTWVKQVEKGVFPQTRRIFSVMRCNHCSDAPCVTICPTQALFSREDGIVDFDKDRCIGCKSCMQACPYDALYIDPETKTAAKCNYCAHRTDIGLEPACVNICPEHAIISGDLDDPSSEIATLVSREQVTARKVEKGTKPNLFYIDGDRAALDPSATERSDGYFWNSQSAGVGHFAHYAEARVSQADPLDLAARLEGKSAGAIPPHSKQIGGLLEKQGAPKRVYDTPDKGLLWGTEVVAYVWTKAISTGVFLAAMVTMAMFQIDALALMGSTVVNYGIPIIGLLFLTLTGLFLIADLDQPKRFLYVLLRPQWKSWLVRGGYSITIYGAALTALLAVLLFKIVVASWISWVLLIVLGLSAFMTSIYTAFLFAQAKGRDFWQSPVLALHMLVHSITAGAAILILGSILTSEPFAAVFGLTMAIGIGINLLVTAFELLTPHATVDSTTTANEILKGRYKNLFWFGMVLIGNLIPLILVLTSGFEADSVHFPIAAILVLAGLWINEKIWVEAPQRIPLS
ncbi:MAG: Fe-S-cluster-containing dehydrogenase component [Limisphaerales bacterium]